MTIESGNMSKPIGKTGPVAFFLPFLGGGGAERAVLEIVRQLIRRGIAVDLIVTRSGGEFWNSVPSEVRLVNLKSWKTLTCLPKLVRYLKHRRPVVLISTLAIGNIVSLFTKKYFIRNLKLIVRHENTFSMQYKYSRLRIRLRILKWLFPVADSIATVSKDSAEDLKNSVPRSVNLVTYVPNPVVNSALFEKARSPLKHPWLKDSKEVPIIMACGRLVPQKDYSILLKAFAEFRQSRIARLMILGDGPEKLQLINLAQDLGIQEDVEFSGFQSNPFSYISRAQVFVLSPHTEGLPTVLIEALACGTPVVSTNCPSGPREILENGRWGTLVPVGDWKALARAIEEALDHPPDPTKLIARALQYSSTASINRHFKLLGQLIDLDDLQYDNQSPSA